MHREFMDLIKSATGSSEFTLAINVDIRGFSSFSKTVESPEVAMFIKRVYMRLIKEYFSNASFFKPTGDGLLIIMPYKEENLDEVVISTVKTCLQVLVDFGSFCVDDPMINFEVPQKVGIGLSRGSACCLVSGDKILDYSGRGLNLASRLMDLARPSGIVCDANFGIELLPDELIELFEEERVFIKGIAEREPINIFYTKDYTHISPLNKQPLEEIKWQTVRDKKTLKQIKESTRYIYPLPSEPIDPRQIQIKISHPKVVRGERRSGVLKRFNFTNFEYRLDSGNPIVNLQFDALAKRLKELKLNWNVVINIRYPEYKVS